MDKFIFLVAAGFIAGILQSIAGLASLASYPALLLAGVSPVIANVTNTTSLIFSGIGATLSSLKDLRGHRKKLLQFILLSLIGSIIGSVLLLIAPASSFEKVVPFFILVAGILLLVSNRQKGDPIKNIQNTQKAANKPRWIIYLNMVLIVFVSVYVGYFGAAGGVLFLAILSFITDDNFIVVNAMKNVITLVGNLTATIIFIFKSHIAWLFVIPLAIGLFIGGYVGPIIVRRVNIHLLRVLIFLLALGLAVYLFITAYF